MLFCGCVCVCVSDIDAALLALWGRTGAALPEGLSDGRSGNRGMTCHPARDARCYASVPDVRLQHVRSGYFRDGYNLRNDLRHTEDWPTPFIMVPFALRSEVCSYNEELTRKVSLSCLEHFVSTFLRNGLSSFNLIYSYIKQTEHYLSQILSSDSRAKNQIVRWWVYLNRM